MIDFYIPRTSKRDYSPPVVNCSSSSISFPHYWGSRPHAMYFQCTRSWVAWTAWYKLPPSASLARSDHLAGVLPTARLPSIRPVIMSFSNSCLEDRMMCPKKLITRSRQIEESLFRMSSCLRMDSFVRMAVHGIRSILRHTHISKASIFLISRLFMHHVSAP